MANKYLKRKFSGREIILLLVLTVVLFVGLYFALVFYPLQTSNTELDSQIAKVDSDLVVAETLKSTYDKQKAAIEDFKESNTAKMPKYNNNAQEDILYTYFDTVFANMEMEYRPTSSVSEPQNGVRTRILTFDFTVSNAGTESTVYANTVNLLDQLMTIHEFRCAMTSLALSSGTNGADVYTADSIHVQCTINFYELDA